MRKILAVSDLLLRSVESHVGLRTIGRIGYSSISRSYDPTKLRLSVPGLHELKADTRELVFTACGTKIKSIRTPSLRY